MSSTAIAPVQNGALATEKNAGGIMFDVIAKGDLSKLSPDQLARYYVETCESLGVNPLTKPFEYISLNNKLTLYALKTCTDQLRTVRGVSIFKIDAETVGDLRIVHAYARDANGREDMDIGAVNVKGLGGEPLANAYMKALTKAKRRVTLSICGLGWLDESEVEAIPNARRVEVNVSTGEIVDAPAEQPDENESPFGPGLITRKQMRHIHALKNDVGMSDAELKEMHGKKSAKELTVDEASRLIEFLKSELSPGAEDDSTRETIDPDTGEITEPGLPGMGAANPQQYAK